MAKRKQAAVSRTINVYKSYSFKDKDPIIDRLRTVVEDSGQSYEDIHDASGVTTSTLYNWFSGSTRRPQFATINAVARALGHHLVFQRIKGPRRKGDDADA